MKYIAVVYATLEDPDHLIVAVPDDHPAVAFYEEATKGNPACIDMGNDEDHLMRLGNELQAMETHALPCQIDGIIHLMVY